MVGGLHFIDSESEISTWNKKVIGFTKSKIHEHGTMFCERIISKCS